jgi:hypothetical protein
MAVKNPWISCLGIIALLLGFSPSVARSAQAAGEPVVIRGGTLIDGTGGAPLKDVRILIEGDTIRDIWVAGATGKREPGNARIIEAFDKFIIPGLIDSHVHYREYMGELFLAHGVTTVFDLGNPYHWLRAVKEGLEDGRFYGPRFYFCGGPNLSANAEAELPSISRRNDAFGAMLGPADAKAIVAATKKNADCLKLSEGYSGELFTPLAAEAKAAGLATISHSLQAVDSANWGITGIEHMVGVAIATIRAPAGKKAIAGMPLPAGHKNSFLYQWMEEEHFDEVIKHLIDRGVYLNPTLAFEWKAIHDRASTHEAEDARLFSRPDLQHVLLDDRLLSLGQYHWADDRPKSDRKQFVNGYRKVQAFLGRFAKAGGKIYAGTDSAAATTPGLSLHHEMELLVDAGLTPMQALQSATRNGAELLRLDHLGTVETGKWADLVVLSRDPLADIRNSKSIETVIKAGVVQDIAYNSAHSLPIPHPGPITKHLYNPAPQIRDVQPPVSRTAEAVTLRISGRGFARSSVVIVGSQTLAAKLVSPTELQVQLPGVLTESSGALSITVHNPKPGGGDSNAIPFFILER